jgi:hypothetical protein
LYFFSLDDSFLMFLIDLFEMLVMLVLYFSEFFIDFLSSFDFFFEFLNLSELLAVVHQTGMEFSGVCLKAF